MSEGFVYGDPVSFQISINSGFSSENRVLPSLKKIFCEKVFVTCVSYFCPPTAEMFPPEIQFQTVMTKRFSSNLLLSIFLLLAVFSFNRVQAQDGKALFSQNCASCHAVNKQLTGPALAGVEERWTKREDLHAWIKNSAAFLKTGDPYANELYNRFNKTAMNDE